jgi:hypothetical protein
MRRGKDCREEISRTVESEWDHLAQGLFSRHRSNLHGNEAAGAAASHLGRKMDAPAVLRNGGNLSLSLSLLPIPEIVRAGFGN